MERKEIENYAEEKLSNNLPAGLDHFKRVYAVAKTLAEDYDDEVLHAAAFLHDIIQDEPHQKLSAEHAVKWLREHNFPEEKLAKVKETIENHTPNGKPQCIEAKMLHDADILDFLGATGIARISGLTAQDWFECKTLKELLEKVWLGFLLNTCSTHLTLAKSKKLAKPKIDFLKQAIKHLKDELDS